MSAPKEQQKPPKLSDYRSDLAVRASHSDTDVVHSDTRNRTPGADMYPAVRPVAEYHQRPLHSV